MVLGPIRNSTHPRLASIALAGGGWWVVGLILWAVGPQSVVVPAVLVPLLGLATVVLASVAYAILWWASYGRERLGL